jgi:hypothetical protein
MQESNHGAKNTEYLGYFKGNGKSPSDLIVRIRQKEIHFDVVRVEEM